MYKLKQIIDNAGADRVINNDLSVSNGVVYLTIDGIKFKHENHNWYQLCGQKWVNLQGGVPDYETELEDNLLFDYFEQESIKSV